VGLYKKCAFVAAPLGSFACPIKSSVRRQFFQQQLFKDPGISERSFENR